MSKRRQSKRDHELAMKLTDVLHGVVANPEAFRGSSTIDAERLHDLISALMWEAVNGDTLESPCELADVVLDEFGLPKKGCAPWHRHSVDDVLTREAAGE